MPGTAHLPPQQQQQPQGAVGGMLPPQQQQQMPPPQTNLYDSVNCDYDAATYGGAAGQNFGNPYDCPEGMYGGSMVSSVGYSKVKLLILQKTCFFIFSSSLWW